VAVWVGNNDNTPMSAVASGVTGASPIWNKIMSLALKDKEEAWPLKPDEAVGMSVCNLSGQLPTGVDGQNCETRFEFFVKEFVPQEPENLREVVHIDKTTGQLATDKTLPENLELAEKSVITDPLGAKFCLDCPPPTEAVTVRYPIGSN